MVAVAIFRKSFHCSNAYICRSILILLHTNILYDNIMGKLELESSKVKVKFTLLFKKKK